MHRNLARGGVATALIIALTALSACDSRNAVCDSQGCQNQNGGQEIHPPDNYRSLDDPID